MLWVFIRSKAILMIGETDRIIPKLSPKKNPRLICFSDTMFIIPTLFRKSVGDIIIASVHLSVRPSVRYVISSQTAGQNPTKFGEWLAYTSGACKSTFIFGLAPRGPGEGSKGQILTISNFKVNLKDFHAKMCTYTQ